MVDGISAVIKEFKANDATPVEGIVNEELWVEQDYERIIRMMQCPHCGTVLGFEVCDKHGGYGYDHELHKKVDWESKGNLHFL